VGSPNYPAPRHAKQAAVLGARERRGIAGAHQTVETCAGGGLLCKYSKHFSSQFRNTKTFAKIPTSSPASLSNPRNSQRTSFASLRFFTNIAKMRFNRSHAWEFCGCNFSQLNARLSVLWGKAKILGALLGKAVNPPEGSGGGDASDTTDMTKEASCLSCPQLYCCIGATFRRAIPHHH